MNVVYASSVDVSVPNGPGVNELEFISALARRQDLRATFILPRPSMPAPSVLEEIQILQVPRTDVRNIYRWTVHQTALYRRLVKTTKCHRFDLIVIRAGIFPIAFWMFLRRSNIPYAVKTAGNGRFDVFDRKGSAWQRLRRVNQHLYREVLDNAIVVDCVSEAHVQSLKALSTCSNIIRVDNGVNIERFYPKESSVSRHKVGLDRFQYVVGYAGNVAWERGGMQLVEVLPRLRMRYGNVGAVIMGGGSGTDALKARARSLGVDDACVFTGSVPYDQVVDYINSFDVGVSLLRPNKEGASEQKVRQYLACGIPVVVNSTSSAFVERCGVGHVVPYDDIDKIYEALSYWLKQSADEREDVRMRARSLAVKELSVEARLEERLDAYRSALALREDRPLQLL